MGPIMYAIFRDKTNKIHCIRLLYEMSNDPRLPSIIREETAHVKIAVTIVGLSNTPETITCHWEINTHDRMHVWKISEPTASTTRTARHVDWIRGPNPFGLDRAGS
eukprot:scaffold155_cov347-Pavlova_lutheri.AAC.5